MSNVINIFNKTLIENNDDVSKLGSKITQPFEMITDEVELAEKLEKSFEPKPIKKQELVAGMKWKPRKGVYESSNCEFNPKTFEAFSYGWWLFVAKIGPHIVFNDYSYSVSTNKHQWKVKQLLYKLGISIHYYIEAPKGLNGLDRAIDCYKYEIEKIQKQIDNPKSRKAKNVERQKEIKEIENKIKICNKLIKLNQKKSA